MTRIAAAGKRFAGVGALGFVLVVLAGAGSPAAAAGVSAQDFRFTPNTVTIHVGDSVTWTNGGPSPHTATADGGSFDSGNLDPGQSFSHTFGTAGTFPYHCQYHQAQGMVGTVVVLGSTPSSGGGGSGGGGSTSPAPPLPNTGASSNLMLVFWLGLGFVLAGGLLVTLRRRRA